ncbi:MAG TPA: GNAT family N-acetyltransferase [Pyrinomonadaceae bacterium]|nr:GNAT family N-acetyltransferase [Pyrinomonadaceae bacterium]
MKKAADLTLQIRPVSTIDEFREAELLQKEVWGIPDMDVVPMYHLVAAKESGGVILGAFDREEMVGFVYGFVGFERGRTVHHSHMLAVREAYRSQGLGYQLKCEQRNSILDQGIEIMTWTFDPLQSRNAFFNFRKLGVVADRYYTDLYGSDAASFLHRNGTDRLWVSWHVAGERVSRRLSGEERFEPEGKAISLVSIDASGKPLRNDRVSLGETDRLNIEIPGDISAIELADPSLARHWRLETRAAFSMALNARFLVEDFRVNDRGGEKFGCYVLTKNEDLRFW